MAIFRSLLVALAALLSFPAVAPAALTAAQRCEAAADTGLTSCLRSVAAKVRRCYADTGAPCASGDARVVRALAGLEKKILKRCPDAATVQAAGFGALMTPAALVDRLQETCTGDPATLAARAFGGPHGALLVGATGTVRACLDAAYGHGANVLVQTLKKQGQCIRKAHKGRPCDVATTDAEVAAVATAAATGIGGPCAGTMLKDQIGLDATTFIARTSAQGRCLTAASHGDSGPLTLDCGPRASVPVPPRGQWVQVVLDEATWGTRCGKGDPYAFWLRLAPAGSPVENVITDQAGGGVCIFEADCNGVPASLFSATDDGQPGGGYLSTNAAVNPFNDWTMLYMPYCTQDVHIGGGLSSVFPSVTIHRFGAINVRAALRYLRDVLWAEMDATDPEGFRPDKLRVIFAGESAGGFGTMYNYHYPLDDLRWANTTAFPDSGLALDNGTGLSVKTLGAVITGEANPLGWGTRGFQPPYCLAGDCAVGPILEAVTSARLKGTPFQQIINVSNQVDSTQVSTTFFPNTASWVNALRAAYCTNQGLNGIRSFFPAVTTSTHTLLRSDARFTGFTADGIALNDYMAAAMSSPNSVVDAVDEGTLVSAYPGVLPFGCTLP